MCVFELSERVRQPPSPESVVCGWASRRGGWAANTFDDQGRRRVIKGEAGRRGAMGSLLANVQYFPPFEPREGRAPPRHRGEAIACPLRAPGRRGCRGAGEGPAVPRPAAALLLRRPRPRPGRCVALAAEVPELRTFVRGPGMALPRGVKELRGNLRNQGNAFGFTLWKVLAWNSPPPVSTAHFSRPLATQMVGKELPAFSRIIFIIFSIFIIISFFLYHIYLFSP